MALQEPLPLLRTTNLREASLTMQLHLRKLLLHHQRLSALADLLPTFGRTF